MVLEQICTKLHLTTAASQLYPPSDKQAARISEDDVVDAVMTESLETARRGKCLESIVWLRLHKPCLRWRSDGLFFTSSYRRASRAPILSKQGMS